MPKKKLKFEDAFARLEEILEIMNSDEIDLDKSIKMYEEAEELILSCQENLNRAEQKIEKLIKNRQGDLVLATEGHPATENFSTN